MFIDIVFCSPFDNKLIAIKSSQHNNNNNIKLSLDQSNRLANNNENDNEILEKILTEFRQIFPSNRIHLGLLLIFV